MAWLAQARLRWRALIGRGQFERDLDEEIRFHLEMRTKAKRATGMTEQEASYAARKQFGNLSLWKENIRAMRTTGILEVFMQDVLYAMRMMRKSPVFAGTAIITLALAIGGNTAMFTIVRSVLLSPLRYRDSDRLVLLSGGATPTRFVETRLAAGSMAELGAHTRQENVTLSGVNEPEVLRGTHVSSNFLHILEVRPLYGRTFRADEDSAAGAAVAMISAELWRRRFGADPMIAGKTAIIDGATYTIIGVLPPGFAFPSPDLDVWMTAPWDLQTMPPKTRSLSPFLTIFGRIRPSVTLEQASAQLRVIRRQYAMAHPGMLDAKPRTPAEVIPMKETLVANVRSMLWILFGAVGLVLMIACANVANLLLTRAKSREPEFALRSALGATRRRIVGQLLSESILLSVSGGTIGAVLAAVCLRTLPGMTSFKLPRVAEVHMDWAVLSFVTGLSALTGLVFGLAPSLGASRPDLTHVLRATGEVPSRWVPAGFLAFLNVRSVLSIGQVALSLVLLIGAALLLESMVRLRNVVPGFNPEKLLTVNVSLPLSRYGTDQKVASFFDELCGRLRLLSGVQGAAAGMSLPMMDYAGIPVQDAAKPKLKLNERPIAKFFPVTPGYFRTLEIPIKRGREFTEHDTKDSQRVTIIDENLARRLWPGYPAGLNPIGQRLWVGIVNPHPAEIVGIVGNVNQNLDDREDWKDSVYVSFLQTPTPNAVLAVRTTGDALAMTGAVREQVRLLDRNQPIGTAETMLDEVEAQVGQRRLLLRLLGSFAAMALTLAVIGIYGVIAYAVSQRVREIGIRRALGAQQADILQLVLTQAIALAAIGIIIGVSGAAALTRLLTALLFKVSATDPATFCGVALVFFVVALVASYLPARRALRIDPIRALRV